MRLPSLTKIPKYKRFSYQPRHFDPAQEELQERVQRIEAEVKAEKEGKPVLAEGHHASRISRAFREGRSKPAPFMSFTSKTAFLRLSIITILVLTGYLWLEYGDRFDELLANLMPRSPYMTIAILLGVYVIYKAYRVVKRN